MLESAKQNLRILAFFALVEHQELSQFLFQEIFKMTFKERFLLSDFSKSSNTPISPAQHRNILHKNRLDIALYKYAEDLFFEKLNKTVDINPAKFAAFIKT